jgi:phosphoenolpyruvate-protein kinase (PTS system EI component)
MCGDMAGDPLLAWILIGLGLRNLSMAPRQIPVLKSIVHATKLADAERLARATMDLATETDVEELVYGTMRERFPVELAEEEAD